MVSASTPPFVTGAEAAEQVGADPFWSVVRRRHPDLDVVVLPAGDAVGPDPAEVEALAELTAEERVEEAHRSEDETVARWTDLVGAEPSEVVTRWSSGRAAGTARVETTVRLDDADPTASVAAVARAVETLTAEGWHVLAPADGLPRVLAGRGTGLVREELQLVLAPAVGRLVLRSRSADVRPAAPADDEQPEDGQA
ncbi:hypothetical protein [Nocardioides abyssi]|uniref:Uncharacterized protein n=1 Tax=Nocardioides abyssi TaxID=3058370 RepID=A0ABT8ES88_9ACTN|nr:hypothetical protein [Nocardioides abyssi]MDN4160982.1 hypothetical protein [Nocardioides abyssi]